MDYPQRRESSGWRGPWTGRKAVDLLVRKFTATLHRLADRLKLGHLASTPACLRVEGATYYAIEGLDLGRLQFLGQWQSTASLAAYIQESVGQLIWLKLRADEQQWISALVQQGSAV